MYMLGSYRDLIENYIRLTSSCKSNPHRTRDIKGEDREGTRDSWTMLCLPDHRGRQVPMDQSCRLLYICLAAHAGDVEAERTSTLITNDTMAMWTGLGHSQLSEAKAKLRNTGWIASEKRSHTSNRTWMYRRPGSWDQQRYDEAKSEAKAKLHNPAEEAEPVSGAMDEGRVVEDVISVPKTTKANKPLQQTAATSTSEPKEWLDHLDSLITNVRNGDLLSYAVASRVDPGKYKADLEKHGTKGEAEALCIRVRSLLPADCIVSSVEQDGHWHAILTRNLTQIASEKLSVHCEQKHTVGKLPELEAALMSQWFTLRDLFCLGNRISGKWLGKITAANNPPAMLYRLWPEIVADAMESADPEYEQTEDEDETEDDDQWDYKVRELAGEYCDQSETQMVKYVRKYYPHLLEKVRSEWRRMQNERDAEKRESVRDTPPNPANPARKHYTEPSAYDEERRMLARADRGERERADRSERGDYSS